MLFISKFVYKLNIYKHQYVSIFFVTILELVSFIIRNAALDAGKFFLRLFIHIIYSFLKSIIIVYISMWMKYKYISPYKACWFFGIINFIIIFIIYIIVSFIPCDNDYCIIEYNGKYYIDNILTIFKLDILFFISFFILKAIILVINYIIIHEFSIFHSFTVFLLQQISDIEVSDDIYSFWKYFGINLFMIGISFFLF